MKTYTDYKDSGIEWIGKIPKHWKITKLKKVAKYLIGGTPSRKNMKYFEGENVWVSIADLNENDVVMDSEEKITDEGIKNSNCKLVPKGSLLYSFKLTLGLISWAGKNLYTNEAIASFLIESEIKLNYLKYLLKVGFDNNARENIYGAKLFNQRFLDNARIIYPPLEEQLAIANYLDETMSKINKIIENKKKQIDLLKEHRVAVISKELSLQNIQRNIPFSGIEWINTISKEYKVVKLKKIVKNKTEKCEIRSDDLKYVALEHISQNEGKLIKASNTKDVISSTLKFSKGDILFGKLRPYLGKYWLAEFDGACSGEFLVMKVANIEPDYFYLWVQSDFFVRYNDGYSYGTKMPRSSWKIAREFPMIVPKEKHKQKDISAMIQNKINTLQESVNLITHEISKLEEYKQVLINEAITGRIKVTN